MAARPALTALQRRIVGAVATGAVAIAGIGFAGSYAAVRQLALDKGFGWFANAFPTGVDAGIAVLLALDLLLTWLRIPYPMLRYGAWFLTAATIAFNGAAAWPDPIGVGMHATIPVLFVIVVEAARHAIGRIADITAGKHMDGVRFTRWLLAPLPTFRLWRRMKLWELRSYDDVIRMERDRLTYRAHLRARYGRMWRRNAPVEAVLRLRLTRYGAPLRPAAAPPHDAPRLTVICTAAVGCLTVPPRPAPVAAGEAPQRLTVICAAAVGALTVPPRPTPAAAPSDDAPVMRPAQTAEAPKKRPTVEGVEFTRHTDEALQLAGMSKAAAVRTVHDAHPDEAAPQIVARLAQHGITVTASYVRTELSRQRKRRTAADGTGLYM